MGNTPFFRVCRWPIAILRMSISEDSVVLVAGWVISWQAHVEVLGRPWHIELALAVRGFVHNMFTGWWFGFFHMINGYIMVKNG